MKLSTNYSLTNHICIFFKCVQTNDCEIVIFTISTLEPIVNRIIHKVKSKVGNHSRG